MQAQIDLGYTDSARARERTRRPEETWSPVRRSATVSRSWPSSLERGLGDRQFKETQLAQCARPEGRHPIDTYPGSDFPGHVDSIQAGTGARFSLLPPENSTGNYVKVVQRVPVKIVFDKGQDPEHNAASRHVGNADGIDR